MRQIIERLEQQRQELTSKAVRQSRGHKFDPPIRRRPSGNVLFRNYRLKSLKIERPEWDSEVMNEIVQKEWEALTEEEKMVWYLRSLIPSH